MSKQFYIISAHISSQYLTWKNYITFLSLDIEICLTVDILCPSIVPWYVKESIIYNITWLKLNQWEFSIVVSDATMVIVRLLNVTLVSVTVVSTTAVTTWHITCVKLSQCSSIMVSQQICYFAFDDDVQNCSISVLLCDCHCVTLSAFIFAHVCFSRVI